MPTNGQLAYKVRTNNVVQINWMLPKGIRACTSLFGGPFTRPDTVQASSLRWVERATFMLLSIS